MEMRARSTSKRQTRLATLFLIISSSIFSHAVAQTPAFPGAEGHGRYVTGGRGGKIVHVTNLNDSGTGSFRQAVAGTDKKIVVFDVGGVIALTRELVIGDNTTILGQTAPSPGITLRYFTVRPGGNNIIRFLRFRRGEEKNVNDGADAIWQREKDDILLDHCSFSWSIDEIASFYDNRNFTMQWCTIGEALANPGHTKGEHSYGGIWGGKGASFHHNFLCHMQNRVPRFCGARYAYDGYDHTLYSSPIEAEIVDFRNCVMYNWGNGNGCYGGTGGGNINIVNNYYKAGPATVNKTRVTQISVATSDNASGSPYMGYCARYHIKGNYVAAADNPENYDWSGVIYDSGTYLINGERYCGDAQHLYGPNVSYVKNSSNKDCVRIKMDEPVDAGEVTTHTAQMAYEKVLAYGGASLYRDAVDARYMDEAKNGTTTYTGSATTTGDGKAVKHLPGIIDFVRDQGTYELQSTSRPTGFDTDKDGIPDDWEVANGLNPNLASDAPLTSLDPYDYYTNLEIYCNSLVQHIMINENKDADEAVADYFPAYYNENDVLVKAINEPVIDDSGEVEVTLSAATNNGLNSAISYGFNGGYTITNNNSKSYATGNNNGIKYSAGVQYTIVLPDDVSITKATFTGYDNYTTDDAYLAEVNGTKYGTTDYPFLKSREVATHTINFSTPATGTITFTPGGRQLVLSITLTGYKGTPVLIGDVNGDGQVGIGDIVAITNVMAFTETDPDIYERANVNGDGDIGIGDIVAVTNVMAGKEK